ncbi:MAG: nucleotidyltransferase family protein [Bacteroidales bacterium]|nr:nucleotidyltransferase family protein [Bacteroidales bacterium]
MKYNQGQLQLLPEIRFILSVICRSGETMDFSGGIAETDIEKLIVLIEKNRITPLFFRYINQSPAGFDPEYLSRLRLLAREHTLKALALQSQLLKICGALNSRGISYMAIKGPQLSHQLYSDAAVRVCVDLDFFLEKENELGEAAEALSELGFKVTNLPGEKNQLKSFIFKTGKHETTFFNKNTRTYIDLHLRPVGNSLFSARYHRLFFSERQVYTINNTVMTVPSPTYYFLFLCQHGAAHQYTSLHWLADVFAFYNRYSFSVSDLLNRASAMKLKRQLLLTLLLLNRLCGVTLPEEFIQEFSNNRLMERLLGVCFNSINRTGKIEYTLRERLDKTIYRFLLAEGFSGKADTVISIVTRYLFRLVNKQGFRMHERKG